MSRRIPTAPRRPLTARRTPTRLVGLAAAAVLALGVTACGQDDEPTATDPTSPTSPTDAATPSAEPTESESGTETAVGLYFVGDSPLGERLYREFQPVTGDPLLGSLAVLADDGADDPDYRSPLAGMSVASADVAEDQVVLTLAEDASVPSLGADAGPAALMAAQSLVYTVQGVVGDRLPVTVLQDGEPVVVGDVTFDQLLEQPALDVLSLVSITTPAEGEQVSGSFTAEGLSNSFEATTLWEVRDEAGAVVLDGFTTAEGWMDDLYPWQTAVDVSSLDPGTYTFAALTDDPSGGTEGPGAFEDTRTIEVG